MSDEIRWKGKPKYRSGVIWIDLASIIWFTGWAGWNFAANRSTPWMGLMMAGIAALYTALTVWQILWRWKSDVAIAYLDGRIDVREEMAANWAHAEVEALTRRLERGDADAG